jgi:hypothetical protein
MTIVGAFVLMFTVKVQLVQITADVVPIDWS